MDAYVSDTQPSRRLLSIVCQGRNDNYMGNFTWRLATVINVHARNIVCLGLEQEVELLVTDWGSEVPLWQALDLSEDARRLVRFLIVPPSIAKIYDRDARYSGTHPINAAARRATGHYTLFSDSDVYVPLETLARLVQCLRRGEIDGLSLQENFFWSTRCHVPNDFVMTNPSLAALDDHIKRNWPTYVQEQIRKEHFEGAGVWMLMPRQTWIESTGWDEKLIHWGWYDIDWTKRLLWKYRLELLNEHGLRAFHFEHYKKRTAPNSFVAENPGRRTNEYLEPTQYAPNPPDWGLASHDLTFVDGFGMTVDPQTRTTQSDTLVRTDTTVAPRSVAEILKHNPVYRHLPPLPQEAVLPAAPELQALQAVVAQLKPKTVIEVGIGLGESISSYVASPDLERTYLVNAWQRDQMAARYDATAPCEWLLNHPFESFLSRVQSAGAAERLFPLRLPPAEAATYLAAQNIVVDMVVLRDHGRRPGARSDVLAWFKLLSPSGVLCLEVPEDRTVVPALSAEVLKVINGRKMKAFCEGRFVVLVPG